MTDDGRSGMTPSDKARSAAIVLRMGYGISIGKLHELDDQLEDLLDDLEGFEPIKLALAELYTKIREKADEIVRMLTHTDRHQRHRDAAAMRDEDWCHECGEIKPNEPHTHLPSEPEWERTKRALYYPGIFAATPPKETQMNETETTTETATPPTKPEAFHPRTGNEKPIEQLLLEALDEVAKTMPAGEVPTFEVQVVLRGGMSMSGAIKVLRPRIYMVAQPAIVPDGRGGQKRLDDHVIEAVFHGDDILTFARPRQLEPRHVVGVARSGTIILPQ